jgi:hypothetical protein
MNQETSYRQPQLNTRAVSFAFDHCDCRLLSGHLSHPVDNNSKG